MKLRILIGLHGRRIVITPESPMLQMNRIVPLLKGIISNRRCLIRI